MSGDARLHPRFCISGRADVIGDEVALGQDIVDLSLGGCRFTGPPWETLGTKVELVVSFPSSGTNLPLHGVVVRATDGALGVKFVDMSDEQKWALRKEIRDLQNQVAAGRA